MTIDDMFDAVEGTEEMQTVKTATKDAGRPRKDPDEVANKRVVLYFTPPQLEEVEEVCFRSKQKVGTFIKDTFFNEFGESSEATQDEITRFINNVDEKKLGEIVKQ